MTFVEFRDFLLPQPAEHFNKAEMLLGLQLAWSAATEEAAKLLELIADYTPSAILDGHLRRAAEEIRANKGADYSQQS